MLLLCGISIPIFLEFSHMVPSLTRTKMGKAFEEKKHVHVFWDNPISAQKKKDGNGDLGLALPLGFPQSQCGFPNNIIHISMIQG